MTISNLNNIYLKHLNIQNRYRKRILLSKGHKYYSIPICDIACFLYESSIAYAITFNNTKYVVDMTLNKIEEELDPLTFYRPNRICIININAFEYFELYYQGKLFVKLKIDMPDKIFVSKTKATKFKEWLGK